MAPLRETIPLRKIKILKKSLGILMFELIALTILCLIVFDVAAPQQVDMMSNIVLPLLLLLPVALLFCLPPFYECLYWKRYFYDVEGPNLVIRKGVIARREITIPFNRITDVYVDQDILDALFGLYDVHVSTPTEQSGRFAHIDGVGKAGSQRLRQLILEGMNRSEG